VGVFPEPVFETSSVKVEAGSRLYLFSDGTYEIDRPDATMMTHEEFSMILRTPVSGKITKLEAIVSEVRRQQQKDSFSDDFSLIEFTFDGSGDSAS